MSSSTTTTTTTLTFRVRVVLPDGSIIQRTSLSGDTFGKIREFLWVRQKDAFERDRDSCRFRLATAPFYFDDNDTIEDLVRIYHVFEELGKPPLERYTILLESTDDYGDQRCRARSKPDLKKPFIWHGYLTKCSKRTGKGSWQRRYFAYQGQTLYWFATSEAFQKSQKAEKWLPMGGVVARLDHEAARNSGKDNVFVLEVPPHVSSERDQDLQVLQAETPQGMRTFVGLVLQHIWNIKIATVLNIIPHLRKDVEVEGLFRLAGDKYKIERIENQIDLGMMPNFESYGDDDIHTKTSLLKRGLRFIEPPLIPTENYENFIRLGRIVDVDQRVQQLKPAILSLPLKHLFILTKLFSFLNFCSKYELISKMNASNLAIVIGPNILRTNIANPLKAMDDSDYIRIVVATLITYAEDLVPSEEYLSEKDREINTTAYNAGITTNQGAPMEQISEKQEAEVGLFKIALQVGNTGSNTSLVSTKKSGSSTSNQNTKQSGGGLLAGLGLSGIPPPPPDNQSSTTSSKVASPRGKTGVQTGVQTGTNQSPKLPAAGSPALMGMAGFDPSKVKSQLRKTSTDDISKSRKDLNPNNNQVDFRSNLKKSPRGSTVEPEKKPTNNNTSHLVDFRSRLKSVANAVESTSARDKDASNGDAGSDITSLPKLSSQDSNYSDPEPDTIPGEAPEDTTELFITISPDDSVEPGSAYEIEDEKDEKSEVIGRTISIHNEKVTIACDSFHEEMNKLQDSVDTLANDSDRLVQQVLEIARADEINQEQEISSKFNEVQKKVIESTKLQMESLRKLNNYLTQIVNNHQQKLAKIRLEATPGAPDDNMNEPQSSPSPQLRFVTATYGYSGGYRPDELTFKKETTLVVINDPNDGWLYGYVQGAENNKGWFPGNYVT